MVYAVAVDAYAVLVAVAAVVAVTVLVCAVTPTHEHADEYRTAPLHAVAYVGMVPASRSASPRLRRAISYGGGSGPGVMTLPPTTE